MEKQESYEFLISEKIHDICCVLSGPYQKEGLEKPTAKDIHPVHLTNIPKYRISDFQEYLSKINQEYRKYCLYRENEIDRNHYELEKDVLKLNLNEYDTKSSRCSSDRSSGRSSMSFDNYFESMNSNKEYISKFFSEKKIETIDKSLSSIPLVYFKSNFELENSRIFDKITDNCGISSENYESSYCNIFSNNTILQEKLSWYLDIVEVHLIKEINNISSSFFSVIDYLQGLNKVSSSCIDKIKELRAKLLYNNDTFVKPKLKIIEILKKKENLDKLTLALKHIYNILNEFSEIEDLIKKKDYIHALNVIEKINNEIKGNLDGSSNIPLSNVVALSSLEKELQIFKEEIRDKLLLEFINELIKDHKQVILYVSPETIAEIYLNFQKKNKINKNSTLLYIDLDEDLRKKIETLVIGLYMTDSIENALKCYYDAILKEVKNILVYNFLDSNNPVDVDLLLNPITKEHTILVNLLKEMSSKDFLQTIGTIYALVYLFVQRLSIYRKFFLDITSNLVELNLAYKSKSLKSIDISDILIAVIDFIESEMVTILDIRNYQNSKFSENDVFHFFALNTMFLSQSEILTGKSRELLQKTVLAQVKQSINNYHAKKMSQETSILDRDQWIAEKYVTEELEHAIFCIIDSAITDPISWKKDFLFNEIKESKSDISLLNSTDDNSKNSFVIIQDKKYFIIESLAFLILILQSYIKFFILIPSMAYDISNNLLELLELYNFKVSQLILGAGAIKTLGLKTITARHLALASHSLSLIIYLIPYILEFIKRHSGNLDLSEFDQIIKVYKEHQLEINMKFVSIMTDRLDVFINSSSGSLKTLDWSKPLLQADDGTLKPHAYMESLVKDILTLHKILTKYLDQDTIQDVMLKVLDIYIKVLLKKYNTLSLDIEDIEKHIYTDVKYFSDNMATIGHVGHDAGSKLLENLQSMFKE
ncbi:hypothetical protein T552_00996 [Pneumocystis carinii B80]|uniref:Vacuolar protein sorting-associated protein 54 C-terminal domain-containing protein n=1 Tax=Pneumocystis carinii (strain B80) TaxID=1408658 RepID=A0A0W4ZN28_PNEC8|nr:hypothetical protein T552_00996 [Pneumocystis carinii B80]KTW29791.1 hypothetical protein T552_00996 [Pneumocystis carinii B80]